MESAVFEFRLFEAADSFLRTFREEPGVRIADALRDELYVRRGAFEEEDVPDAALKVFTAPVQMNGVAVDVQHAVAPFYPVELSDDVARLLREVGRVAFRRARDNCL